MPGAGCKADRPQPAHPPHAAVARWKRRSKGVRVEAAAAARAARSSLRRRWTPTSATPQPARPLLRWLERPRSWQIITLRHQQRSASRRLAPHPRTARSTALASAKPHACRLSPKPAHRARCPGRRCSRYRRQRTAAVLTSRCSHCASTRAAHTRGLSSRHRSSLPPAACGTAQAVRRLRCRASPSTTAGRRTQGRRLTSSQSPRYRRRRPARPQWPCRHRQQRLKARQLSQRVLRSDMRHRARRHFCSSRFPALLRSRHCSPCSRNTSAGCQTLLLTA